MNKFRTQLKKFGMEKEFTDWMKKQQRKIVIGSRVRVKIGFSSPYYRKGDKGTVQQLGSNLIVKFDAKSLNPGDWFISSKNVEVI